MKKKLSTLFLIAFIGLSAFAQEWTIAPKYKVAFSSKSVSGKFEELTGDITFDPEDISSSKFVFVIKIESIATGNFLKNSHAKGADWFNASEYPYIKFISNSDGFKKTETGYEVTGYLQMHGVRKLITIPFTFNKNVLNAKFTVDRTEFGIGDPDNNVGKVIKINATIPVIKK